MFTGPVGPVEVFFYWPEAIYRNFYRPGAIGLLLVLSPGGIFIKSAFQGKHYIRRWNDYERPCSRNFLSNSVTQIMFNLEVIFIFLRFERIAYLYCSFPNDCTAILSWSMASLARKQWYAIFQLKLTISWLYLLDSPVDQHITSK